jgi:formamidopyrimidine-DNA glycosylase
VPELPDAAGYRRLLAAALHHLDHVEVHDAKVLRNAGRGELDRSTADQDVRAVHRHGKWLVLHLERAGLVIHLGMTGSLVLSAPHDAPRRHDRAVLRGDADIVLRDPRRLGGIWLAADIGAIREITGPLGPDAARITATELRATLHRRRTALKTTLMDQTVIAGLGNTLTDEILWRARLHPRTRADSLSQEQIAHLHAATRDVVRRAARAGAIPRTPTWLTSQRSSTTPTCPRCGHRLERSVVNGRTALWCPSCQSPTPRRAT